MSLINSLHRLERVGDESSVLNKKLLEAATEMAERIIEIAVPLLQSSDRNEDRFKLVGVGFNNGRDVVERVVKGLSCSKGRLIVCESKERIGCSGTHYNVGIIGCCGCKF